MNKDFDEQNSTDNSQAYMLELEKVYNRYLCWDRDGVPYGYMISFIDNIVGNNTSLERSFVSRKSAGAENFKRAYFECLEIQKPKEIKIYEYNGTSRNAKPMSAIPITIKIINTPMFQSNSSTPRELTSKPSEFSVKSLFSGLMGIEDDGSGKNGSMFILDLMDNVRKKDEEIMRLTNELNHLSFEIKRIEFEKENLISKAKDEQYELQEELAECEQDIEALEEEKQKLEIALQQANERLESVNLEKQKVDSKNNLYQLGSSVATQFLGKIAIGYARSKPNGILAGLDEDAISSIEKIFLGGGDAEQVAEEPIRRRREVEEVVEEKQLSPEEKQRRETVTGITSWLQDNWQTEELIHLVDIINYLTNQPARMKVMLDAINRVVASESKKASEEAFVNEVE